MNWSSLCFSKAVYLYGIKVVVAVAANLFLALTEPKCLSKCKKGDESYRVKTLQVCVKHLVYVYSWCLHIFSLYISTLETSHDTDFVAKMPFRAAALLNVLWCEILSEMGQAWTEGCFNWRQKMLSYRKWEIPFTLWLFQYSIVFHPHPQLWVWDFFFSC